jgi:cobalt-zinc-cadmium resistance protein CzcA
VGGNALTQVLQGEQRYDLVARYQAPYRDTREAIANIRLLSPSGERVSLAQLCKIEMRDGGSEIYREGNQRYVAVKVQRARARSGKHGGRGHRRR